MFYTLLSARHYWGITVNVEFQLEETNLCHKRCGQPQKPKVKIGKDYVCPYPHFAMDGRIFKTHSRNVNINETDSRAKGITCMKVAAIFKGEIKLMKEKARQN